MGHLSIAKAILGIGAFSGIGVSGAYFGTKSTVEEHFSNLQKNISTEDWDASLKKLKENKNPSSNQKVPQSNYFKDLNENADNIKSELESKCQSLLKENYKLFWKTYVNEIAIKEAEEYCFKSTPS